MSFEDRDTLVLPVDDVPGGHPGTRVFRHVAVLVGLGIRGVGPVDFVAFVLDLLEAGEESLPGCGISILVAEHVLVLEYVSELHHVSTPLPECLPLTALVWFERWHIARGLHALEVALPVFAVILFEGLFGIESSRGLERSEWSRDDSMS